MMLERLSYNYTGRSYGGGLQTKKVTFLIVHWDGGQAMRKFTECLMVVAFLLCAFTAQAASVIDVSVPSAGEPCSNDLQCGEGEVCVNDICSAARPCTNDLQCDEGEVCVNDICSSTRPCTNDLQCDDGELCIDDVCQEAECETSEDCGDGLICDNNTSFTCVECLTWTDCDNQTICSDNNTCVPADDCDLRITPKKVKIKSKKDPFKTFKLTIKGNENFTNPVIPLDTGFFFLDYEIEPLVEKGLINRWTEKRRKLEMVVWVPTEQESGFYTLRFGNCLGEIEIENKTIMTE
jgi:hypothetical protein